MKKGKAPYITDAERQRTLDAQTRRHSIRDRAVLWLSHCLGLRAKELSLLRIEHVYDFVTRSVKEDVYLEANLTKGGEPREVYFTKPDARQAISDYLSTRSLRHPGAPLFMSQKGGAFSANTMQKLLHQIYTRGNVKASSHTGRRCFATALIEGGADIDSVRVLMGHKYIETTKGYFTHSPERLKRMVTTAQNRF